MSGLYDLVKDDIMVAGAKRKKLPKRNLDFEPTEIPNGFVLLVDTREQLPLFTKERLIKGEKRIENGLMMIGKTIKNGDYSIGGLEKLVAIERKQQSDFEAYISSEYKKKTLGKLNRLKDYYFKALIIEADENDLYEFPISPHMTREKVRNHLISFRVHYGVHIMVDDDREALERFVLDCLVRCYRYLVLDKQKETKDMVKHESKW